MIPPNEPPEDVCACGRPGCDGKITKTVLQRDVLRDDARVVNIVDFTCTVCGDEGVKYPPRYRVDPLVHHATNHRDFKPICGKTALDLIQRIVINPRDVTCPDCIAKFLPGERPQ